MIIEDRTDIVRVDAVESEADDPGAVLRPKQRNSWHAAQRRARFGHKRALMGVDGVEPDPVDPIDCRVEADGAGDVRRPRLEPRRRRQIGRSLERHPIDHCPATLPRRHRVEQFLLRPQRADAGWPVNLVRRENVEVGADRGDIDRQAWRGLAAVEQQLGANLVRDIRCTLCVEDRTEHVRHMGEGDNRMVLTRPTLGGIEVDPPVFRQRHDVDFVTRQLPWNDIAVMLELAQQDALACSIAIGPGDQVDRLGRAAGEDDLKLFATDQRGGSGAGGLETGGHGLQQPGPGSGA